MKERILLYCGAGIGNTVLQTPTINAVLDSGRFDVDILFANRGCAAVCRFDARIGDRLVLEGGRTEKSAFVRSLRTRRYARWVSLFPSNRGNYNRYAFFSGARQRIIHRYAADRIRTMSFLSNVKVPVDESLHDVQQNLRLLAPLGILPPSMPRITFSLDGESIAIGKEIVASRGLAPRRFVGIHAGCTGAQEYRRWPAGHFKQLIKLYNDRGVSCALFAGPDEIELTRQLHASLPEGNCLILEKDLNVVGAVISHCGRFISTDSGLGHIASAMGVPSYAIFGPAMWGRTRPYGSVDSAITLNLSCSPCLNYPFRSRHSTISCIYEGERMYRCLKEISPERVFGAVGLPRGD